MIITIETLMGFTLIGVGLGVFIGYFIIPKIERNKKQTEFGGKK